MSYQCPTENCTNYVLSDNAYRADPKCLWCKEDLVSVSAKNTQTPAIHVKDPNAKPYWHPDMKPSEFVEGKE